MPVKVIIPTPLRQYTGKQDAVEVRAKTVGDALSQLTADYADLKKHLFTEDGKLRTFVNIYLNDEDIRLGQDCTARFRRATRSLSSRRWPAAEPPTGPHPAQRSVFPRRI
jgi:adenylyltransferase/sulfurtransferase